jgi:hypothetical protein
VARLVRWSTRLEVIAHSQEALLALRELGVHPRQIVQVPHPILRPSDRGSNSRRSVARAIRVLGQFKDGRDRDLLQGMARHLEQLLPDVERSIHGSDWPAVDGWSVDARFVPEAEFEALIAEAGVIVIPYRHFFQSGVAVRALERAVPVVLPRTSFGEGTFGASASCLLDDADPEAWAAAVARALNSTPDLQRQHEVVWEQASQRWAAAVSPKRDH